ncbi:type II toxin-antitoxin system RelE/ParE family toxin [Mesorhizobium sp. CAU 1732]|uniref:type II toxin-antitoxin system RelE/ParE family toxin n=1 Tax=Mesorhizobium sp. CAU 1732 TaxID=3140358 RepID=UPI003260669C
MKSRIVRFSQSANNDLKEIYRDIRTATSWRVAGGFIERIEHFCRSLDLASERGTRRDELRRNVRTLGFERSLTIVFEVDEQEVHVLRIFRAGRDWESEFSDD